MSTATQTVQAVASDSPDWKRFLKRVIRDNEESPYGNGWLIRASAATEWRLQFEKTIRGKLGEADAHIEILTNCKVSRRGKYGNISSFSDSKPVIVLEPRYICIHSSEASVVCRLLLDGASLVVCASAGSSASSEYGLAFYNLHALLAGLPYSPLEVGSSTVTKDGVRIISGAVGF